MSVSNRQDKILKSKALPEYLRSGKVQNVRIDLGMDSKYVIDEADMSTLMAMDATFNDASNGVPQALLNVWTNKVVEQITQRFAFTEIATPFQQGDFATPSMTIPTVAMSGAVADYGDFSGQGQSNTNANWERRDVYQGQTWVEYGDLAVARWSGAKLDYISQIRRAGIHIINQTINQIGFFGKNVGVANIQTYGLLTDPALNPVITAALNAAGTSRLWVNKTPVEITADILAMFNDIVAHASNNVWLTADMPMTLALRPQEQTYLASVNQFGLTGLEWVKKTFPRLKIVTAIQYQVGDGLSGNKAQLILDEVNGQKVVQHGFSYQFQAHRLEAYSTYQRQKFSFGDAGAVIFLPLGISTIQSI